MEEHRNPHLAEPHPDQWDTRCAAAAVAGVAPIVVAAAAAAVVAPIVAAAAAAARDGPSPARLLAD